MRPRMLDLFCGAGGAAVGYHRAGFDVVGMDIVDQPNYPFEFVRADALGPWPFAGWDNVPPKLWHRRFDASHASPPCQAFTAYQRTGKVGDYPHLIAPVRELLQATGLPWVIENVERSPVRPDLTLCGTMFDPPMEIQRHRVFESNVPLHAPHWPCRHMLNGKDRYPGGRSVARTGASTGLVRGTIEIGSWDIPQAKQNEAMGIDWMTLEELSEAIPPAYTEFIGAQLLAHINAEVRTCESST